MAVTGAAGQVAYAMLRAGSPPAKSSARTARSSCNCWKSRRRCTALEGVAMELDDCGFPTLQDIVVTDDPNKAFNGRATGPCSSARPRASKGMERKDLLGINGKIFVGQGKALAKNAASDVRILVVGNPCNTNCLVAYNNGRDIPAERWTAMTRLDHNRARSALAKKAGVAERGRHQRDHLGQPLQHAVSRLHQRQDQGQAGDRGHHRPRLAGKHVRAAVPEPRRRGHQGPRLQLGACRRPTGRSITSRACCTPTPANDWVSIATVSKGEYGVPAGLVFGYPCKTDGKAATQSSRA